MKVLNLIGASLLMASQVYAQNAEPAPARVLPPPPWLNKAASMSHWVITYAQTSGSPTPITNDSSSPENANPTATKKNPTKTIEVTKTGKTILEKTSTGSGPVKEIWRANAFVLMKNQEKRDWYVGPIPPANDPFEEPDYATTDFAGFNWISANNFVGIQVVNGTKCLSFKDKVLALSVPDVLARKSEADRAAEEEFLRNPNLPIPKVGNTDLSKFKDDVEADIDLKTLLPVSLQIGKETRTYKFLPAPNADLELPEDAQLALIQYQKKSAAMKNISAGSP